MTSDQATLINFIEDAANVLCWRGYFDPDEDEEIPGELVAELTALYQECEICRVRPDGLADHWVARQQAKYERSLPTWTCECGTVFKPVLVWNREQHFYRATDDGLLGDLTGTVRTDARGRIKHSDACAECGRRFAETMGRQADAQQTLF
jgi:hypothetical protein